MKRPEEKNGGAQPGKYLTIVLAGEVYGLAAVKVRELVPLRPVTPVPQMPDYVKGVFNLHGRVVPVVDLRFKFGLPAGITERTCIVVVHVALPTTTLALGLIVDGVEDVANLAAHDIESGPVFGAAIDPAYLLGEAKIEGRKTALLDLDRFIVGDTLKTLIGLR